MPRLHASVERADRTQTEESTRSTDAEPELAFWREALLEWEHTDARVRPYQALGYLAPAESLALLGIDV